MGTIVVELTNRCNLTCAHCLSGRHGGGVMLPLAILEAILREASSAGFNKLSFTGGEPSMHPQFGEILRLTHLAGYRFGIVTNGWNFPAIYTRVLEYAGRLSHVTFSLDGATRQTHDAIRGHGSYDRLMKAFCICMASRIPFTINMTINARNRHELRDAAQLAQDLGSRGLRYGHLMGSAETGARGLDPGPAQRKVIESEIRSFADQFAIPIHLAPGFHTTSLFPCDPLELREVNVDCHGNLTKCCHLSGHDPEPSASDVIGNLAEVSFAEAMLRLAEANAAFRAEKLRRRAEGLLHDDDFFPCWYCAVAHGKVDWLRHHPDHPWAASPQGDRFVQISASQAVPREYPLC